MTGHVVSGWFVVEGIVLILRQEMFGNLDLISGSVEFEGVRCGSRGCDFSF